MSRRGRIPPSMLVGDWRMDGRYFCRDIECPECWQDRAEMVWILAALDKLLTLALPCRCPLCPHDRFRRLQEARGDET